MNRTVVRVVVCSALSLGAVLAAAAPAAATCVPGKVGVENGKPVVELPRCEPPPQ